MATSVSSTTSSTTPTATSGSSSTSSNTASTTNTSTTSSADAIAAANKSAAQALISSLGAGSGVDTNALATNLVNAEKVPQQNIINGKITKEQQRISGYSAVSYVLTQVNSALTNLKDKKDFNTFTVDSSSSAFTATASVDASIGTHDIDVYSLAKAQRSISSSFLTADQKLNTGQAMTFSLTVGSGQSAVSSDISVTDGNDTPQGLVNAINAANKGVTAQLANTGDPANPYKIVLIGQTGASNAFTLTPKSYSMGGVGAATDSINNGAPITIKVTTPQTTTTSLNPIITQGDSGSISGTPTTEQASIQFSDVVAGSTVNVGGLILTASTNLTASQVAQAFATNTAPTGSSFSGNLSGYVASTATNNQVSFTSTTANTNVTDLTATVTAHVTQTISLAAGHDTPNDIIAALNSASVNGQSLGLSASLVPNASGSTFANKLFVSGAAGFQIQADYGNGFKTLVQPSTVSFSSNQTASDARVSVDGVSYTRATNTLNDVLTGVTLNLKGVTTTGTVDSNNQPVSNTGTLSLARDNTAIKTNVDTLVSAYNDAMTIFGEVTNPKSTLDTYGATLVGDSTVRSIQRQLRDMLMGDSSTPGTSVSALWQLGVSIDQTGKMSVDSTKLDTALSSNYSDVVTALTGNQNDLLATSTQAGGIAGDAYKKISAIVDKAGVLATQTNNSQTQITKYQDQLTTLSTRMDMLLTRYQTQFAAMNSLVGSVNSQKTSLKSSFDGMMAMYTNKA